MIITIINMDVLQPILTPMCDYFRLSLNYFTTSMFEQLLLISKHNSKLRWTPPLHPQNKLLNLETITSLSLQFKVFVTEPIFTSL